MRRTRFIRTRQTVAKPAPDQSETAHFPAETETQEPGLVINPSPQRSGNPYGLTDRQWRFVLEYLQDYNATHAAIRAGYSAKNADKIGSQLLGKPRIREAINAELAKISARLGVTPQRIIDELARIAFVDPTKLADFASGRVLPDASPDDRAVIQSIRVKRVPGKLGDGIEREIRFADKIRALELLGKITGILNDKQQLSGTVTVQIIEDIPKSGPEGMK